MGQRKLLYVTIMIVSSMGSFGIGFFSGESVASRPLESQIEKLQAQIENAKRLLPFASIPQETRNISGIVKEMRGNIMVLGYSPINPFDESPRTRSVTIVTGTKITRNEQKDQATIEHETREFQKAIQSQKSGAAPLVTPPSLFREIPAVFSDIRAGQQVSVTAAENIRDAESFAATQVTIVSVSIPVAIPPQSRGAGIPVQSGSGSAR